MHRVFGHFLDAAMIGHVSVTSGFLAGDKSVGLTDSRFRLAFLGGTDTSTFERETWGKIAYFKRCDKIKRATRICVDLFSLTHSELTSAYLSHLSATGMLHSDSGKHQVIVPQEEVPETKRSFLINKEAFILAPSFPA